MPTLESVLAGIPGAAGFYAKRQMNEQGDASQIQQASALVGLRDKMQAAAREQAFRGELAALGPNATQEQLAAVGAKYSAPKELLAREQGSLDRQASIQSAKEARAASLEQAKAVAEQTHEARMARITGDNERRVETTRHNTEMERLRGLMAQLGQEKPPSGYRKTSDGGLEAIPGGPADTKIQGQFNADTATLQQSESALDRLSSQVNLVKNSELGKITGIPGVFPNIPGGSAANAKARLEALKYQIGFNVLQEMKNASKTNASGLGQITEKEHIYLQNQLGSLERAQSEEEIRRVLDDISKFADESKGRIRAAYNLKHKDRVGAPTGDAAPATPGTPSAPAAGAPAGYQEGQTATGPGGQRIVFKGGKWQPMTSP